MGSMEGILKWTALVSTIGQIAEAEIVDIMSEGAKRRVCK